MDPAFRTRCHKSLQLGCLWAAWSILGVSLHAANLTPDDQAYFEAKVRPLLVKHCYDCHSHEAEKIKGGLLLDSKEGWVSGGDSGEAIVPGSPDDSLVMEAVRYGNSDLEMPPKYKLSDAEVAVLENWIAMGAPDPRVGGAAVPKPRTVDWEAGQRHWAFQPVRNPAPPTVQDAAWVRDDLDRFILSKIEEAALKPAPDADRFALVRRVTLDLTGLPPSVEEVAAFVRDPGSDDVALAKLVDRLLQSPAFGERWGRHWLDVARYADSVGKTRNVPFPHAWRYRNYVIDSFNADKPYDEFLAEQVAGDLLPSKNSKDRDENLVATGLLALGSMDLNENNAEQFRLDRIDDQIDTLGRATMALTLGCARCHDHKFDPIAQTDYYALAGIFGSTRTLSGQVNKGGGGTYYDTGKLVSLGNSTPPGARPTEPAASRDGGPAASADKKAQIARLQKRLAQIQATGKRKNQTDVQRAEFRREYEAVQRELAQVTGAKPAPPKAMKKTGAPGQKIDPAAPLAMAAAEGRVENIALRVRGEPSMKGEIVPRGFPTILTSADSPPLPADASGRLEFAQWLTSPQHPLPARVMANRVWAHLLGRGIVPSVDNFGASGAEPSHPELLDHLAWRFIEEDWSVKTLIRSIVLSRTYRLSGENLPANLAADEDNALYWKANLRRLEAEAIRDSLLAAGGMLQEKRPDGAPFDASLAGDLAKSGGKRGGTTDLIAQPVRSVYLPVFRSKLPGMFTVFDFAEPDQVNGRRDVTTVAPQALFLLNNPFVVEVAEHAADRILEQELSDEAARVRYAYAYALCRYPTGAESNRALKFLGDSDDRRTGWASFLQALYASAEFRYVP